MTAPADTVDHALEHYPTEAQERIRARNLKQRVSSLRDDLAAAVRAAADAYIAGLERIEREELADVLERRAFSMADLLAEQAEEIAGDYTDAEAWERGR